MGHESSPDDLGAGRDPRSGLTTTLTWSNFRLSGLYSAYIDQKRGIPIPGPASADLHENAISQSSSLTGSSLKPRETGEWVFSVPRVGAYGFQFGGVDGGIP